MAASRYETALSAGSSNSGVSPEIVYLQRAKPAAGGRAGGDGVADGKVSGKGKSAEGDAGDSTPELVRKRIGAERSSLTSSQGESTSLGPLGSLNSHHTEEDVISLVSSGITGVITSAKLWQLRSAIQITSTGNLNPYIPPALTPPSPFFKSV